MTKQELIAKLKEAFADNDVEDGHEQADQLLLEYISDEEVSEIFNSARKWYS